MKLYEIQAGEATKSDTFIFNLSEEKKKKPNK